LAVLASLVYLGFQVSHALRAQKAAMHQARVERVTNVSLKFVGTGVPELLAKAGSGATDFSATEVLQLFHIVRIQVLAVDDAFWQADAGFLDAPSLDTTILTMKRLMANPVFRAAWHLVRPQVAPAIRARIDIIVKDTLLASPQDWALAWKEAYAEIVR
jgi:hypothetical protein